MIEDPFRHEALLYAGEGSFLDSVFPFIEGAVDEGDPIMVALPHRRLEMVRSRLGADVESVRLVDMEELGQNPARIIPAWRDFAAAASAPGRKLRGVGEPIWAGRSEAELTECQLHEALLNVAFEDCAGFRLVCPYDTETLPADVIDAAHRSHPMVSRDGMRHGSHSYCAQETAAALFDAPLPPAPSDADEMHFRGDEHAAVRALVADRAGAAGLDFDRRNDLLLAVTEATTNSACHGSGGGRVGIWVEDETLVCEVADEGSIDDMLVGRRRPAADRHDGGWGLWIANHVCDLVQVRSGARGSIVRLHMALR